MQKIMERNSYKIFFLMIMDSVIIKKFFSKIKYKKKLNLDSLINQIKTKSKKVNMIV